MLSSRHGRSKTSQKSFNGGSIGLEGFSQDNIVNASSEQSVGNWNGSSICTPKCCNRYNRYLCISINVLEVHKSLWDTKISPVCSVWVKSLLVVSTNPTWRVPPTTKRSSEARGWMWGGLVVPARYPRTV